jgi:hypothetical protein
MEQKTPEQLADDLLEAWAASQVTGNEDPGDVLRRNGILNRRRIAHVHGIEISLEGYERRHRDKEEEDTR